MATGVAKRVASGSPPPVALFAPVRVPPACCPHAAATTLPKPTPPISAHRRVMICTVLVPPHSADLLIGMYRLDRPFATLDLRSQKANYCAQAQDAQGGGQATEDYRHRQSAAAQGMGQQEALGQERPHQAHVRPFLRGTHL